jgi:molybdenum cofactor cytidylyltransferase
MTAQPVALILSAGASSRFGGRPKALLSISGEPAISRLVRVSREEGFEPRVVVGMHSAEVRQAIPPPVVDIVENPEWESGRTGSIQHGLEGISEAAMVLIWPVDHPFVQAMTLRRLCTAAEHDPMGIWFIPTYGDQGGHPVLLKPPVLPWIRRLNPSAPLRSLIPGLGPQVVRVPVDDPGVRANVDTEQDYLRFRAMLTAGENPP